MIATTPKLAGHLKQVLHLVLKMSNLFTKSICKILLHNKLSLMKTYIKALDKDGPIFKFLHKQCPHISEPKLRTEIFDGLQLRELAKDEDSTIF